MALKIRLRKQGRTNRAFYRLVVADCRSPRDGKYIEKLGWYNPFEQEDKNIVSVDAERLQHWLSNGAQLTPKAESLVSRVHPEIIRERKAKVIEKKLAKKKAKK